MLDKASKKAIVTAIAQRGKTIDQDGEEIKWDELNIDITYAGVSITLPNEPEEMPLEAAVAALQRRIADENQMFTVREIFHSYPTDAAVAFVKAMQRHYGWASPTPIPRWWGEQLPEFIHVKIGPHNDDVIQCPIGGFNLPGIEKQVQTLISELVPRGPEYFIVLGKVRKKDRHVILQLVPL